jgi:hypothetical protein
VKHQKTSEDQETDDDDTTECEQVTNQDARKFIAGLQLYFMQESNEGSPICGLETCTDFVRSQSREHGRVHLISSSISNCYKAYVY